MAAVKTILVVDDEPEVRYAVARRLEKTGYAARLACGGAEALSEIAVGHPDAIILDVRMPGIDGVTVLSELQKNEGTKGIPVIMLSASIVDERRAIAAGARFFLKKPYRGVDLVTAVAMLP
jgi:chemosensory pili system protein ChpA (sensor histidine kinase/response regulator)